jgi:site-specific DNA-cytosine methylase
MAASFACGSEANTASFAPPPRALDLFSGIGGMALGVHAAFPGLELWRMCEADPACRDVLARRFPGVPCEEDVVAMRGDPGANVQVVYGGFPCQDVSCAGRRAGVEGGTRSSLFEHMIRLAGECRAPFLLLENVTGLRRNGLDVVCARLREAGYAEIRVVQLRANEVGMRHHRPRLFIAARNPALPASPRLVLSADPLDTLLPLRPEPPDRLQTRPPPGTPYKLWQARLRMLGNSCVPRQALAAIRALFLTAAPAAIPASAPAAEAWEESTGKGFVGAAGAEPKAGREAAAASPRALSAACAPTLLASDSLHARGRQHQQRGAAGLYKTPTLLRWVRHNPQPGTWGTRAVTVPDPPPERIMHVGWAEWFMGFPDGWLG